MGRILLAVLHGLPGGAVVKKIYLQMQELQETQVNPEVKKGPGGGNGSVLAWSNPMDRGAWRGCNPQGHQESNMAEVTEPVGIHSREQRGLCS